MRGLASEAVDRPREPGALFVALRFLGGLAALSGAAAFGLLSSGAPCLPTAAQETWWSAIAIGVALGGFVAAVRAWSPDGLMKWLGGILGLAVLVACVVAPRAHQAEQMRIQATTHALQELAELTLERQGTTGQLPRGSGPVESVPALLSRPSHFPAGKALPSRDGWGGHLYFQSDGTDFAFLAPCRCGRLDARDWRDYDPGWLEDPRADIMFVNGRSFRFPRVWNLSSHHRLAEHPPPR